MVARHSFISFWLLLILVKPKNSSMVVVIRVLNVVVVFVVALEGFS